MNASYKRFDMNKPPVRTRWYLWPITLLLSFPSVIKHKAKLKKIGMEGIKPPYVLLCNHNSFLDFKVATRAIFPRRANYVVAIDGFIGRKWLLQQVGCICKRKFTSDIRLVRQLRKTIEHGDIAVIYPEARYSLCGTTAVLPESLGKLCKLLKVPVVSLICHGHHVTSPFWNLRERGVMPTEAEMTLLFTPEQLKDASIQEVNSRIVEAFQYDDFAWQKERGIRTPYAKRAEGLHKVLYQCPACGTEFEMTSEGTQLICKHCGKRWNMTELGELEAVEGETEFSHIPDWYEWERANVRREVEAGTYSSGTLPVYVNTLPNALKFRFLGNGTLLHDMNGFHVHGVEPDGERFDMDIPVAAQYSCHIEYEYLGKYGDCIDLNTLDDTWYIYPGGRPFAVTKMALATEELYFAHCRAAGRECPPGLV